MGKKDSTVFHKRQKLNLKVYQKFQIWLLVRIVGTCMVTILVAIILLYLYSKGSVDAEYLSFKPDVRRVSEILLPAFIAASLASIFCGLLIALFLPQKIAGPLFRIEQDMLQVSKGDLTKSITLRCADILKELSETINMAVGNIGNMVEVNLISLGRNRLSEDVQVSEETSKQLAHLQEQVSQGIDQSVNSLLEKDDSQAKAVYARLPELKQQTDEVETRIALRLTADEPNRVATYRLETEIIENLKNMYFVAMRIANMVAPQREALASI